MTISSTIRTAGPYAGTGSQQIFPFAFKVFVNTDLLVTLTIAGATTIQSLTSQYTVSLNPDQNANPGGSITMLTAPPVGATLLMTSQVPELQPTDLSNVGNFYPQAVTDALDRLTILIQQLDVEVQSTLRVPIGELVPPLPAANLRAGGVLGFDSQGNPITTLPASGSATQLAIDLLDQINLNKGAAMVFGAQRVVDTIAGLRALPKTGSKRVFVAGYYAIGDGGGGPYWYDPSDTTSPDDGGGIIVANDGGRWKLIVTMGVSVKQFGAKGDNTANDKVSIQKCHDYAAAHLVGGQIIVGAITGSYAGSTPRIYYNSGKYKIDGPINREPYSDVLGEEAWLIQTTPGQDLYVGAGSYQWKTRGITFIGGRYQVNLSNDNIDSSMFLFEDCEFHLSSGFAINTFATGGTYQHMSANLTFRKCRFLRPRQVINNCCDSCLFDDCWVTIVNDNFDASTAAFVSNGGTTGHSRLFLRNMFGVPSMGVVGVDRLANVRWIDNCASSVYATGCRFGGEDGGIPIVLQVTAPPTVAPWLGWSVEFDGCWLYAGQSTITDSGVVILSNNQIPQSICIKNCTGPADVPYITNTTGFNIATYIANWQSTTGRLAYNYWRIDIRGNASGNTDGLIYLVRMPNALRPYLVGAKRTDIRRTAAQSLTALALGNNLVSFDTVVSDNVGAFAIANPTNIIIPPGVNKCLIVVNGSIASDGTAKIIETLLLDVSGNVMGGPAGLQGISTNPNRFSFTVPVDAIASSIFRVTIRHSAAAALSLTDCRVTIIPQDFVQ